jgi:probable phosphoglycerate mutase
MRADLPPLYILRHGETEWNRDGRLQGHLDSPLTATGRQQAAQQAQLLNGIRPRPTRAFVSDSGRALHTARIALDGLRIPVTRDARLREVGLGAWQGLTPAEIAAGWADRVAGRDPFEWKFDAPGGESLAEVTLRVSQVLAEIARLEGPTVVVTHGVTSRVLRCLALGRSPDTLGTLPGGQGVVHAIENGRARVMAPRGLAIGGGHSL